MTQPIQGYDRVVLFDRRYLNLSDIRRSLDKPPNYLGEIECDGARAKPEVFRDILEHPENYQD